MGRFWQCTRRGPRSMGRRGPRTQASPFQGVARASLALYPCSQHFPAPALRAVTGARLPVRRRVRPLGGCV